MMDTKRIPENHPVRRYTRPFILLTPNTDGKGRFLRGSRTAGKGVGAGGFPDASGALDGSGIRQQGKTGGSDTGTRNKIRDRSTRREGETSDRKPIETEEGFLLLMWRIRIRKHGRWRVCGVFLIRFVIGMNRSVLPGMIHMPGVQGSKKAERGRSEH
jgi:hypothetical protein